MKELLLNIITKNIKYTKTFIEKARNNIKFEDSKNEVIKAMYDPILEKKIIEKNMLLLELSNIRLETDKLNGQIKLIKEENELYNKKVMTINSFEKFIVDNR